VDCLTFLNKKSDSVKCFAKLLISRFRKLVFFAIKEMWHL